MKPEFEEYLKTLGISRATFYRRVKTGELSPFVSREKLIKQWIRFNCTSPYVKPWSDTYKKSITRYLQQYFRRFEIVSSLNLELWLSEVDPIKKSLRRHRHSCVSSYARFLHHIGRLSEDELRKIKNLYPKTPNAYRPNQRILTNEQVEILYQWDLCKFLAETGLRISEYSSLKPSDLIYSDDPLVAIINVRNGKGNKSRVVPFSRIAQSCEIRFGRYKSTLSRDIRKIAKETGIGFSAHSLRHYRITQWANNPKVPIAVTQKWAGHSSIVTTQRYIHITDEEALKAVFG